MCLRMFGIMEKYFWSFLSNESVIGHRETDMPEMFDNVWQYFTIKCLNNFSPPRTKMLLCKTCNHPLWILYNNIKRRLHVCWEKNFRLPKEITQCLWSPDKAAFLEKLFLPHFTTLGRVTCTALSRYCPGCILSIRGLIGSGYLATKWCFNSTSISLLWRSLGCCNKELPYELIAGAITSSGARCDG